MIPQLAIWPDPGTARAFHEWAHEHQFPVLLGGPDLIIFGARPTGPKIIYFRPIWFPTPAEELRLGDLIRGWINDSPSWRPYERCSRWPAGVFREEDVVESLREKYRRLDQIMRVSG